MPFLAEPFCWIGRICVYLIITYFKLSVKIFKVYFKEGPFKSPKDYSCCLKKSLTMRDSLYLVQTFSLDIHYIS